MCTYKNGWSVTHARESECSPNVGGGSAWNYRKSPAQSLGKTIWLNSLWTYGDLTIKPFYPVNLPNQNDCLNPHIKSGSGSICLESQHLGDCSWTTVISKGAWAAWPDPISKSKVCFKRLTKYLSGIVLSRHAQGPRFDPLALSTKDIGAISTGYMW